MSVMADEQPRPAAGGDLDPPGPGRVTGRQLRELLADDLWLDEVIDRAVNRPGIDGGSEPTEG